MTSPLIYTTLAVSVSFAPLVVLLTAVTAEAAAPGAPTSLAVYSTGSEDLEARWPSSDFAATTGYKVQWKSGSQEYDASRQASADPATVQLTVLDGDPPVEVSFGQGSYTVHEGGTATV